MTAPAMMLRRLPFFGACQLSGPPSIARTLGAINSTGCFHVQSGSSRSLASTAMKPVIRDPERPVKPATPWLTFLQEYRKGHPSAGMETVTAASKEWKAMPDGQKTKFIEPYEAKKKIYEEKMKVYTESGKKDAWNRDPDRPKAPASAYIRFAQEFRTKNPGLKVTESSKKAGAGWKELKAEEKQRFEEAYKAEKEKYDKDLEAYKASGKEDVWKAKVGITAVQEKEAQKKAKALERAKMIKAKTKAKMDKAKQAEKAAQEKVKMEKAKQAEKAAQLKEKEKVKMEKAKKEKAKMEKAKQAKKAAQLKEKEKAKMEKAKQAEKAAQLKEKEKAKMEKAKQAKKAAQLKEKKAKMEKAKQAEKAAQLKEKEKVKMEKAKQAKKAAQLKEKEKTKKAKAKLAAETAKLKQKAMAATEKLKGKSAGTSKQGRA